MHWSQVKTAGEDPVLKEDAAYPDWLWKLAEPKKQTSELFPDSQQHWRRNRKALARCSQCATVLTIINNFSMCHENPMSILT